MGGFAHRGGGLHEGALRGPGRLCVRRAARPGVPGACRGMHGAGAAWRARQEAPAARQAPLRPRRGLPGGRGRLTHLLKSKGIVPPPPGVGALQARRAAAPRGSLPAANASSGRPAPAGRPPPGRSPLASAAGK